MMQLAKQTTRASALRTSAVPRPSTSRTVVVRAVDGEKTPEGEWIWPWRAQCVRGWLRKPDRAFPLAPCMVACSTHM
jgi:hypothetical protein